MSQAASQKRPRRHRSCDALIQLVRRRFQTLPEQRRCPAFARADTWRAGRALFSLQDPSPLAFCRRAVAPNLRTVFGLQAIPSDTQLRTIRDDVDPQRLRRVFRDVFRPLQRGQVLEQ